MAGKVIMSRLVVSREGVGRGDPFCVYDCGHSFGLLVLGDGDEGWRFGSVDIPLGLLVFDG